MKVGEFPKLLTPVEIEQEIEKTARGKLVLKLITEQWLNDRLGTACDLQEIFEIPLQKTKSHGSLDIGALHPACEAIIKYCDRHRLEIWSKPQSKIKVPAKIKISASDLLNRVTTARQMIFECLDIAQSISADVRKWVCNSAELKSFDPGKLEGLARTLTFYGALIKLRDDSSGVINLHARNIDIEGFDTKFLELNQARLERLYVEDSDRSNSGLSFEAYFGLIDKARRVRMRCLDPKWAGERGAHFFQDGDIEVEVPVAQRELASVRYETIYIVENLLAYQKLPLANRSLVLWGRGAGILGFVRELPLRDTEVIYWGDLDYAGFQILANLRLDVPHARSMLMDMNALESYSGEPVNDVSYRTTGDREWIQRLNPNERDAFLALNGKRVEQEFLIGMLSARHG